MLLATEHSLLRLMVFSKLSKCFFSVIFCHPLRSILLFRNFSSNFMNPVVCLTAGEIYVNKILKALTQETYIFCIVINYMHHTMKNFRIYFDLPR